MGRAIRPGEEVSWTAHPGLIHGHAMRKAKKPRAKDAGAAAPDKPEPGSVDGDQNAKPARKRSDKP